MLQYLNIGSAKLKCSVELNIRFITGVKTFHVGDKMTFVINQREGLHNLCLKTKDSLLNVSEKLSLAFFWPKDPTNLVLVDDLDLSNGTQHLASYPEEILDTDLETEDLIENVMPIYHDTPESKRLDIIKTINYHKHKENLLANNLGFLQLSQEVVQLVESMPQVILLAQESSGQAIKRKRGSTYDYLFFI